MIEKTTHPTATVAISDIYQAAYVYACGHPLRGLDATRPWRCLFLFDAAAQRDADGFFAGAKIESRLYANAIRDLRTVLAKARRGEAA